MDTSIMWKSRTKNVDEETGEEITKFQTREYLKIKTDKYVKINKKNSKGYIEWTIRWRRNPQRELEFRERETDK